MTNPFAVTSKVVSPVVLAAILAGAVAPAIAQIGPQFVQRPSSPWATVPFTGQSLALDMDGDGDQDVFAISALTSLATVRLWRNDGSGVFTDVTATHLPSTVLPAYSALALDVDVDGDLDLIAGGYFGLSTLLRNQGNGTFVASTLPISSPAYFGAADFDGDGDLDLAITETFSSSALQRLWRNNGSGGFTAMLVLGPATQGSTMHPFDHDGDGDLDLLCGKNPMRLWRNDGGFVFTDISATTIVQPTGTALGVHAMGDLDGDGDLDVIVSRNGTPDVVMLQQSGVFTPAGVLPHSLSNWLVLNDVDADGDLDVIHGYDLRLSLNDGTGGFTDGATRIASGILSAPAVADFDADGDTDLIGSESLTSMTTVVNRAIDLVVPPPQIGLAWPVAIGSQPGYALLDHPCVVAIGLVRLPQPLALPGLGLLWLDPAAAALFLGLVPASSGVSPFSFVLPAAPQLVGLPMHVQGLVAPLPAGPLLTAVRSVAVQ